MTHRIREAVILITFSSARVHGRAAYDLRCVFYRPSAVTEPTSERRNDEADKHFQTGETDSRAGGERCTDELGGNCQGRPPSKQQRAKHRPPPSLRDQQSASQREESDALPKRKRWRKEEGVRKNYCSHSRMWSELQKSEWAGGWF
jgi:hypothetical protein